MDFKKTPPFDCKGIFKFLIDKNKSEAEIHQKLGAMYSEERVMNVQNPETKTSSSVWETKDEPSLRQFKMEHSAGKVMWMAFWECWGLVYTNSGTDAS